MSLYRSSVNHPVTVSLVFVTIAILGIFSLRQLAINLLPDMKGIVEAVSYKKIDSFDGEDIPYTQAELTQVLTENLKNKKVRK